MPPLGRVEGRDAHQPMHAALAGQLPKGVLADDGERGRLDARLFAVLVVVHLGLEALLLGPAQIHAHQHLGPVLALRAARAGMHGDDGVQRIGLAIEHGARFKLFGKSRQRLDVALQIGQHVFALARQLEVGLDVAGAAHQLLIVGDQRLQALAVAHQRLGSAGFDHRAGSASLVSISASSLRMRAGSKILPQVADLIAHGSISEFEIVQRHVLLL